MVGVTGSIPVAPTIWSLADVGVSRAFGPAPPCSPCQAYAGNEQGVRLPRRSQHGSQASQPPNGAPERQRDPPASRLAHRSPGTRSSIRFSAYAQGTSSRARSSFNLIPGLSIRARAEIMGLSARTSTGTLQRRHTAMREPWALEKKRVRCGAKVCHLQHPLSAERVRGMGTDIVGPFAASEYSLGDRSPGTLLVEGVSRAAAISLSNALASVDPWRTLAIRPEAMADALQAHDPHYRRYLIRCNDQHAGVVGVRYPWLYGPYLALLAVLPAFQGKGIGTAVLDWIEHEVRDTARNSWVCASAFNVRALSFYGKHGYQRVGVLDGLLRDGHDEVLMRKKL